MVIDAVLTGMQKELKYDDFELIKKLGDGNFTEVYKVQHKKLATTKDGDKFYALKQCSIQKVSSMNRTADILMEKHALNKLWNAYGKEGRMPCVKLIGTFKDQFNLYFLTEILSHKNELWEHCRSFGLLSNDRARFVFKQICMSV